MKIAELTTRLNRLNAEIAELLKDSGYATENDFCPDEYQPHRKTITDEDGYTEEVADLTPDEWQLVREYKRVLSRLDEISWELSYLARPVVYEGTAYRKPGSERYCCGEVDKDYYTEYCCGHGIEFQLYDEEHDCYVWKASSVEYADEYGGYFIVGYPEIQIAGLRVRVRE
jgi:hypothetical protein